MSRCSLKLHGFFGREGMSVLDECKRTHGQLRVGAVVQICCLFATLSSVSVGNIDVIKLVGEIPS